MYMATKKELEERITNAVELAACAMTYDYDDIYPIIDEMVRELTGDEYEEVVKRMTAGDGHADRYPWYDSVHSEWKGGLRP